MLAEQLDGAGVAVRHARHVASAEHAFHALQQLVVRQAPQVGSPTTTPLSQTLVPHAVVVLQDWS